MTISPSAIITEPRDILNKLRWEIEALRNETGKVAGRWRLWNAVATGWHAVEIFYKSMSPAGKRSVSGLIGVDITDNSNGLGELQTFLRDSSRAARLAQQLTNSSKHLFVSKHTDLDVSYTASAVGTVSVSRYIHKVIDNNDDRLPVVDELDDLHIILSRLLDDAESA